jgi:hypothetical protein
LINRQEGQELRYGQRLQPQGRIVHQSGDSVSIEGLSSFAVYTSVAVSSIGKDFFVLGAMGVEGGVARLGDNDFEVTFEAFNQFGPILVEAVSLTALLVDVRPGKPC